jgi:hypothetical protein
MKANINIEIGQSIIIEELREVIQELVEEEIKNMVKTQAQKMVEESVKNIITPIVNDYLKTAIIGRDYVDRWEVRKKEVDKYIKDVLINYLNEPCYQYNKSTNKLSEKYKPSSQNGDKRTRAEHWVTDIAIKVADEELWQKIERTIQFSINAITPSEEELKNILRKEIQERIKV